MPDEAAIIQILNKLTDLAQSQADAAKVQATLIEQQSAIISKLGQVISQLNKHSHFLVQHERAVSRCLSCRNFSPLDSFDDTREITPPSSESGRMTTPT